MELLSNYLSKPVISVYEAEITGTVINAAFDRKMKRLAYLIILNEEADDFFIVPASRIMTSDTALTVRNRNAIRKYIDSNIYVKSPINRPVYTTDGERKGIVKDVSFDEKSFEVIELDLEGVKVTPDDIASVSDNLVILKGEGFTGLQAPRNRRRIKRETKTSESAGLREEQLPIDESLNLYEDYSVEETYDSAPIKVEKSIPARIISDYSFLLDRLVLQDVFSLSGELIIPANTRITPDTVETARRHGKLVELTVGSRLI
ncbi:MAG: PRC-barrel domain-containing protein [Christensenellales bacterium]|jgi:sporulation protein YlmC with PRC-barrel domain